MKTTTLSIKMPVEATITKRNGASVTIDVTKLHADILADLFIYGLRQKVNDSASGAPEQDASQSAMEACVTKLVEGEWTIRSAASESDPLDPYRIKVVRKLLAMAQNAGKKKEYDAIPSDDQKARRDFILSVAAEHSEAVDKAATQWRDNDLAAQKAAKDIAINF